MGLRLFRAQRLWTLLLLLVAIGISVWWSLFIWPDSMAIYRPVPARATLVGRHLRLPERWLDVLGNPLVSSFLQTAGVPIESARELVEDPESLEWFQKLAGGEGTIAFLPERVGCHSAWVAVSHLGGQSQILRWQLSLFRVPGYRRMSAFPERSVWRVDAPDLEPGQTLVIAFGEGVLMACLSMDPLAIEEVLAAYDGRTLRLMETEPSFEQFALGDDRTLPDRFWLRDESEFSDEDEPGIVIEVPVLRKNAVRVKLATKGAAEVPGNAASTTDFSALARRLGSAPCLAISLRREVLEQVLEQVELSRDVRHALQMVLEVATDEHLALFAMEGEWGGRLTLGAMRLLGAGLRVPTILIATPAPDADAAHAALQRVLNSSNARYRAAFILQPMALPAAKIYILESAGRNEWVDDLPLADRPAFAVLDGWVLAASNLGALQKIVEAPIREKAPPPPWLSPLAGPEVLAAWGDLARSGKSIRGVLATWSLAQMALGGDEQTTRILNQVKTWTERLESFAEARVAAGREKGTTTLSLDLGLSDGGGVE